MPQFDYELELEKAREVASEIQKSLASRVLGCRLPAWKCCCGNISHGEAQAIKINPAGHNFRPKYQVSLWYLWNVEMQEIRERKKGYAVGLARFIPISKLDELFSERFKGINIEKITDIYFARKESARN